MKVVKSAGGISPEGGVCTGGSSFMLRTRPAPKSRRKITDVRPRLARARTSPNTGLRTGLAGVEPFPQCLHAPCQPRRHGETVRNQTNPMSVSPFLPPDPSLEKRIREIGEKLFAAMDAHPAPGIFSKKGAYARVMEWAMKDPAFKAQLFRFVDVLPTLKSSAEI